MREKLTYLFVHQPIDNPTDPRVETRFLDYDANGNITHIEREINNPELPMDDSRESVQKLVWDEEDRLLGVDLRPESDRGQPHIAAYTYDAGGERGIRYVPRQQEGVSSGTTAGYAQDMDIMLYPNALITVRPQELPEDFDPMRIHPEHTFTTYTKHYYIGSERINSKLGTVNNLGLLCEEMRGSTEMINEMNDRANGANKWLEKLYQYLDKELEIAAPYLYSINHSLSCGFKSHNPKLYDAYWYHPDHLGSSSFITNTTGEISQHLEYLPFGETLVEEHLNSYNSPFKFNGKECDAETGNYYYGARYMNPKWSMWLGVDPLAEKYPYWSPFAYTFQNPINFIDPDGRDGIRIIDKKNKTIIIKAVYYVQTEVRQTRTGTVKGYTSKQIAKIEQRTNKWLNKQNLSVTEGDYEGYNIQFDLSFEEGGHTYETIGKANMEQYEGYDIGNSIERLDPKTAPNDLFKLIENEDGTTSQTGGVTANNKNITMNTAHDTQTNQIHEIGHTLGLKDNTKTGARGGLMEYPPRKISQKEANQLGNNDFLPAVQKPKE